MRAYIFVDPPKFVTSPINGKPANVQYLLKNYGRSPGILIWLIANVRTEPNNDSHPVWSEIFNGQKIFKSGDEWPIEPHVRAPAYPVGQPIGEPSRLLIVQITYSDVFDYMHVSEFTFFESEGSFYAISGKEYNRNASAKAPDKWAPAWSNNLLNEQENRVGLSEAP